MRNVFYVAAALALIAAVALWYFLNNGTKSPNENDTVTSDTNELAQTITETDDAVTVDFNLCAEVGGRIWVAFGSTSIRVFGKTDDGSCWVDYGGEVENPNWDGALTTHCLVPASVGILSFAKEDFGVDLTSIDQYCQPSLTQENFYSE